MIFIDQMKNLKIYKKPMFLPTVEGDKKKYHTVLMLTPNYESSKRLLNSKMFVNRLRYQSYYLDQDVSFYINGKNLQDVEESVGIQDTNKYIPTEGMTIDRVWYYTDNENRDNAMVKLRGFNKNLRGRSEMLVLSQDRTKVFLWFKEDGNYSIPGGSWKENEDHLYTAIRETEEEIRVEVKDVKYAGNYINLYNNLSIKQDSLPSDEKYFGAFSEVYIGIYDKEYTGNINSEDQNDNMLNNGKFYDIDDVINRLNPIHKQAIEDTLEAINEMTAEERNKLPDSEFGLPKKRKYPLDTPARVKSAIRFFNYVDKEDEAELARNIIKAIHKFHMEDKIHPQPNSNNRFYNYYKPKESTNESVEYINEDLLPVEEMTADQRNKLPDSAFGLPKKRKYPLDTPARVKSAIRFFNYVSKEDEAELARNIIKAIHKFHMEDQIHYSERNRFFNYYKAQDAKKESSEFDVDPDLLSIQEMKAAQRNKLPDSAFGIPSKRKYPLDTAARTKSAIRFFNYVGKEDEAELARRIIRAIHKYGIEDQIHYSKRNRFFNYYKPKKSTNESYTWTNEYVDINEDLEVTTEQFMKAVPESSYINLGDKVIMLDESSRNDTQLKLLLYKRRIRRREQIIELYDRVKRDVPYIKFAFPDLKRYTNKNLFVDLYYYNEIFFENNTWVMQKGMNLYLDLMQRLINNPKYKNAGYKETTLIIPISDWCNVASNAWNFRKSLSPLSIIYQLMFTNNTSKLKEVFGNTDIIFMGSDKYFKINFSEIDPKDVKKRSNTFRVFLSKIINNEEFDEEDIDTTLDNGDNSKAIKADIIDKIEDSKGIDITKNVAAVQKTKEIQRKEEENKNARQHHPSSASRMSGNSNLLNPGRNITNQKVVNPDIQTTANVPKNDNKVEVKPVNAETIDKLKKDSNLKPAAKVQDIEKDLNDDKVISKLTLNRNKEDSQPKTLRKEVSANKLADYVDDIGDNADSEDDAMDMMDTDTIKDLVIDLGDEDDTAISDKRAERMNQLDKELMQKEVNGRTIEEILEEKPEEETEPMNLDIASPTNSFNNLTFVNFDKNYDIDKDIINCFRHFSTVSRPIAIRNISVEDTSTSMDRIETYRVEMEDYKGNRFTVVLDIPIMVDNRFYLRGGLKSIECQFFNMPIIKTDLDTCQIISNYMKIFVRRYGSSSGKSLPNTAKFIKAANKYNGRKIKFYQGNNKNISAKYHLPMDYIDLANTFSKIETDDFIIYFNQDEIRNIYVIEEGIGTPYLYLKKDNQIAYYAYDDPQNFIDKIVDLFMNDDKYKDFQDLFNSAAAPSVCTYSRCSIMSSQIPLVVICGYHEGLRKVLDKAHIQYKLSETLSKEDRNDRNLDWIRFNDGYLIYYVTYESSLLLNGLKDCRTEDFSFTEIDNKNTYLEFLDDFGGRIKADGLDNFYDLMVDPITREVLEYYNFPTDYVSILLYANALLADNKYTKHTDTSSRRMRRYELIAVYTYKVLADAYASYSNMMKHGKSKAGFVVKRSAVIDKFLTDSITSEDSCINALRDIEATNAVTTKGPSGMNEDRSYGLDKRTYDDSMLDILGMSTGFAGNVGITRQATLNANVEGTRGYVNSIEGDTSQMNTANTLTATEAITPFGSTRDDPFRSAMTFIQTSKHEVRTDESDPLLVTNGSDEALAYMTSDRFAYKAKKDGVITEVTDQYIMIKYDDGTEDYVNLTETIEHNSDGGYYVPLKLDKQEDLKVGSIVKKNQIVAYDKSSFSDSLGESDNIAYNVGKLAKVAVLNSDEGFEDSGIITEKMANKLATRVDLQFSVTLDKLTNVLSMKKVGDKVEASEDLIVWQAPYNDEDVDTLLNILSKEEISDLGKKKLKSEVTGVIKAIKIYRTVELDELSDSLRTIVDNYEQPYRELEAKLRAAHLDISQIPAHSILPTTGKLKKAENSVVIEFYVEYKDSIGVGDKVVYYSANKAVEKNLIPIGLEPYTEFRPNETIDAFVSEVSIDKRMVTSTIIYGSLQKLMIELDRSVKDIMGIKYDDSTV